MEPSAGRNPDESQAVSRALAVFAVASLAIGLIVRIVHRGDAYPGWDVVGAANGLYLLSTRSLASLAEYYAQHQFDGMVAWNVFGVPVALFPGLLTSWWPWHFWAHTVTAAIVAVTVLVLARALRVPRAEAWTLALAWAASPALLSFTVSGLAYVSNALPYAIALWVVLRHRSSVIWALLVGMLALVSSWHLQELGRTVFLVFFAGAVLLRGVAWRLRATWLVLGGIQCGLSLAHQTFNTARYAQMAIPPVASLPMHAWNFVRYVVLEQGPDLPMLLIAGVTGALALPARWFWAALIAAHAGLLFLLSSNTGLLQGVAAVWPRRVLLLDFVCVGAAVSAIVSRVRLRPLVLGFLVVGNVWQLTDTLRWAAVPLDAQGTPIPFAMPYTHTPTEPSGNLDSRVPLLAVEWVREMRADLARGKKVILAYNLSSYDENGTDPAGVPDRLYVGIGHDAFVERVWSFGDQRIRWSELPIRPMAELDAFVDGIDPAQFVGYWMHHPNDDNEWPSSAVNRRELAALFTALLRRFDIVWGPVRTDDEGRRLLAFTLAPKAS